jgi:hypothetical protein
MGTSRTRLWSLLGLLVVVLLAGVFVWRTPAPRLLQARDQARRAWEIRHVQGLEEALEVLADHDDAQASLVRARVAFLQGRLLPCLDLLAGDAREDQEGWDSLREQAWEALALDVPWPATVPSWVRLAEGDLVRVVDDGGSEGLFLEAFGERQGLHGPLRCELQRPEGTRLREDRPLRVPLGGSARLEAVKIGASGFVRVEHLRQGRRTLDLGTRAPWGLLLFRFQGASAPTLEGATVRIPAEKGRKVQRWTWEDGGFRLGD